MKKYKKLIYLLGLLFALTAIYFAFPIDLDDFLKTRYFTYQRDKLRKTENIEELKELHSYYTSLNSRNSRSKLKHKSFKKIYENLHAQNKPSEAKSFALANYNRNSLNFVYANAVMQEQYKASNRDSVTYYFNKINTAFPYQNRLWEDYLFYLSNDSLEYSTQLNNYWSFCSPLDFSIQINEKQYDSDYYFINDKIYTAVFENTFPLNDTITFSSKKHHPTPFTKLMVIIDGDSIANYKIKSNIKSENIYTILLPKNKVNCRIIEINWRVDF